MKTLEDFKMKTENNSTNKAIFLSQYWNQEVLCIPNLIYTGNPPEPSHEEWIEVKVDEFYIMKVANSTLPAFLTPLSQITDEDAIEITKISICRNPFAVHVRRNDCGEIEIENISQHSTWKLFISGIYIYFKCGNSRREVDSTTMLAIYDYLRSKGYALPWMGLSVDELVEYGWVKLKDND